MVFLRKKEVFRVLYFAPIWLLFLAFRTVMILLGWIFVPLAAGLRAYRAVDDFDGAGNKRVEYHFTSPWMYPWDNNEDGIANDTYVKFDSMFMKIVYWACFRNPANNLRFIPYIRLDIDPTKVQFVGSLDDINNYDTDVPQWFLCWQGIKSCVYIQWNMFGGLWRFWLGWKVFPTDIHGVTPYRKDGAGFATQFKRVA